MQHHSHWSISLARGGSSLQILFGLEQTQIRGYSLGSTTQAMPQPSDPSGILSKYPSNVSMDFLSFLTGPAADILHGQRTQRGIPGRCQRVLAVAGTGEELPVRENTLKWSQGRAQLPSTYVTPRPEYANAVKHM